MSKLNFSASPHLRGNATVTRIMLCVLLALLPAAVTGCLYFGRHAALVLLVTTGSAVLFDFFGELLTEHQRSAYEGVVMGDLSYAELARLQNISRQAAYDMIRRCDRQLEEYEAKLHLVERFLSIREELQKIEETAVVLQKRTTDETSKAYVEDILKRSGAILEEL